jgi:methylated-DNA-[protein]-cysteine S-methyltransferase
MRDASSFVFTIVTPGAPAPIAAVEATIDAKGAITGVHLLRECAESATPSGASSEAIHTARALEDQLGEYFGGQRTTFELRLEPIGTPFQLRVWEALRRIPNGETRTYGDLARELGKPGAARAIGGANGRNPIALVVPCHRVVATNGLGGYTGGLDLKRALLRVEGVPA